MESEPRDDREPRDAQSVVAGRALRIARYMRSQEGIGGLFDISADTAEEGRVVLTMRITAAMTNGFGIAHGGAIFTLAEIAFAYACNSRNVRAVAQGCSILFLSPAWLDEQLKASAEDLGAGGRSASVMVVIRGDDDWLAATMQGHSRAIGGSVLEEN